MYLLRGEDRSMKEFFTKAKEVLKRIWKPIAVMVSLISITKLGGFFSKWKSTIRRNTKEIKKEIKTEIKEVDTKVMNLKEQEKELTQSLEEKDKKSEELKLKNTEREEDLKTFLPNLSN